MELKSYEALEAFLRNFETWDNTGGFDVVGAVHLFAACLDCLQKNLTEQDLDDLSECLTEEQAAFLQKLSMSLGPRR